MYVKLQQIKFLANVDKLNQQIIYLQNKKMELEEKMDDFLQKSQFFHNGKCDNSIRAVCQDLLCMGLSIQNLEKIISLKRFTWN